MANDRRIQEGGKQKQERMTSEQKKNEWQRGMKIRKE